MTLRRLSHLPLLAPLLFMAVPGMAQNNACVNQINGLSLIHISEPTRPY